MDGLSLYVKSDYKEKTEHGSVKFPLSIHHTYKQSGTEDILYKHWHYECELLIVTKGKGKFVIEEQVYEVKESEGLFIPPKCLHSATHINHSECEFFAIVFHPNIIANVDNTFLYTKYIYPLLFRSHLYSFHFSNDVKWQKKIYYTVNNICQKQSLNFKFNDLAIKGELLIIWQSLYNNYFIKVKNDLVDNFKFEQLKDVFNYIEEHYRYEIKLKDLSDLLAQSEGQFCRQFKKITGMTPFTHIIRFRIMKSCELLTLTDKKISEVADLSGFSNISYFNRTFKSILKCSPKTYRKRNSFT